MEVVVSGKIREFVRKKSFDPGEERNDRINCNLN
jgi:hypothetical protein